ncbi:hypothetical protein ACMD2_15166 [Ananas comosus]|uniref:DUF659 domain-containing protein n=1 Tax=Ananas comosus TaxID=4615 RepID=A0A199V5B4_ANACO|nr:hypothetical protein ACMD2_15166 [Ananas comosus]
MSYEIAGKYLDVEVNDIHVWVKNFKQQWEMYGVTLMVVFHKSVYATGEIGEKYIVQVVSDNSTNFKKPEKLIMQRNPHLFWTPCRAHCINLMMFDFGEINQMKKTIDTTQRVSKYLYNHLYVHVLMVKFTEQELVSLGITRLATNFIALNSILQNKNELKFIFVSNEWQTSRYASTADGKSIEQIILSAEFWDYVKEIVDNVEPLCMILRLLDQKKIAQMGHAYYKLRMAKDNIKKKKSVAVSILSKNYRQTLGYPDESGSTPSRKALRNVINRLASDPTHAVLAINKRVQLTEDTIPIPIKWWLQYGGSAKHLKNIVMRVLSQTTTSGGYERNWSTFVLIHTKVRNQLAYAQLEKLFYVHYNMRLRLRCIARKADKNIEWSQGNVQEQTALDEKFQNPADDSNVEFEHLKQGPGHGRPRRTQSQSGKEKTSYIAKRSSTKFRSSKSKKSMTLMDPLDATDALPQDDDSDTSTPADSGLPRSKDECSDDDDTIDSSENGGNFIPSTQ